MYFISKYVIITTLRKFSKKYFHSPKYLRTATNTVDHGIVPTLPSSGADGGDAERPNVDGAHADGEGVEERTMPSWAAPGSRRDGR